MLNRKMKARISMEIQDLRDSIGLATGTRVVFTLPVLYS